MTIIAYYICPYDIDPTGGSYNGPLRQSAIYRHISSEDPVLGITWREVEILNNHVIVGMKAPQTVHDKLATDPDIIRISTDSAVIQDPVFKQKALTKFQSLGYTKAEIEATNWDVKTLLKVIAGKLTTNDIQPIRDHLLKEALTDGLP